MFRIYNEDCLNALKTLAKGDIQFDSVVTDPPYELGFMNKSWDNTGLVYQKELWKLVFRVLKPGGHLIAFGGSRTYHRLAVAIEDAGFEIRDQIMWLYGSGFPKNMNVGNAVDKLQQPNEWQGWGTALKPAHEPIVLARKPIGEKNIADNLLKHRTGGINIDGSKFGESGRYPANVMHDGSDDVLEAFPDGKESPARFFYCPKVSKKEREAGLDNFEEQQMGMSNGAKMHVEGYDKGQGIGLNRVISRKNIHPTVKPIALMEYLCALITPPNGKVLDPFMGSGSTGIGAINRGFYFIGIEKEKEYCDIAEARINHVCGSTKISLGTATVEEPAVLTENSQSTLFDHIDWTNDAV